MVRQRFYPRSIKFLLWVQPPDHRLGIAVMKTLAYDAQAAVPDQFLCCAFSEDVADNRKQQLIARLNGFFDHAVNRSGGVVHLPGNQRFMPGRLSLVEHAE